MAKIKVVELRARSTTHQEIAHKLQVSRTFTSDIAYLCSQAKESIKEYATVYFYFSFILIFLNETWESVSWFCIPIYPSVFLLPINSGIIFSSFNVTLYF